MNNGHQGGSFRPRPTAILLHLKRPEIAARLLAYGLFFAILLPCLALSALLVSRLQDNALSALNRAAQTRASLAALYVDQQVLGLVRTLKLLAPPGSTATGHSDDLYARAGALFAGTGIDILARNKALDPLSPTAANVSTFASLNDAARVAAAAAFATAAPQVTPFRDEGANTTGVNLWLASGKKGGEPILLQAHIPAEYLNGAFKDFPGDDSWSMEVVQSGGAILARLGRDVIESGTGSASGQTAVSSKLERFAEAFSTPSQFGWRVRAATPLGSIEAAAQRNWARYLVICGLLTAASFAAATIMSRHLIDNRFGLLAASGEPAELAQGSGGMRGSPQPHIERLQETEQRSRIALTAGHMGVWQWARGRSAMLWDAAFADLLKLPPGGPVPDARAVLRRVDRADRRRFIVALRMSLSRGQPLDLDIRLKCFDDTRRWLAVRGTAIRAGDGKATGLIGLGYDITAQKQSLLHTDALLREVSHRSKNLLALILAMARLTAREAVDVKSHLRDFALRVAGLAASQDLIVAADWQSVDLGKLAAGEIEAVVRSDATRVTIMGPAVMVTPEAAQALGMILAELSLNAAQHGALSTAGGLVNLSWDFPEETTLAISWREIGGPAYDRDRPKGYGMSVVERFSSQGLKFNAHVSSDGDGFLWTLTGPLANVGARAVVRMPADPAERSI